MPKQALTLTKQDSSWMRHVRCVNWLFASLVGGFCFNALGQTTAAPVQNASITASTEAPAWVALNPQQQRALQPLAGTWDTLSDSHKRKWISLAKNYDSLAQEAQGKLQERMVDWTVLSAKERQSARLNFAQSQKLAPQDRSAKWEAYQALSPEEKQKLAANGKNLPHSAAIAVKPVGKNKLVTVPVTRQTPADTPAAIASKRAIDRNTLLPLQNPAATSLSAP